MACSDNWSCDDRPAGPEEEGDVFDVLAEEVVTAVVASGVTSGTATDDG